MLQTLLRKAESPVEFLDELYTFAVRYNQETNRRAEYPHYEEDKGKHKRPIITQEDLLDFQSNLLGLAPEEQILLCKLLVASGSGWPRRYEAESEEASAEG